MGTKASTINTELNTIKAALNRAVSLNYLARNPCREVKKLKSPRRQVRFLNKEEIHRLLQAGSGRMGPIIEVLLYSGLRRDELAHLTWADIYTVQKLLGHSSIKTTEIYAHLAPDFLKSAVERLRF